MDYRKIGSYGRSWERPSFSSGLTMADDDIQNIKKDRTLLPCLMAMVVQCSGMAVLSWLPLGTSIPALG